MRESTLKSKLFISFICIVAIIFLASYDGKAQDQCYPSTSPNDNMPDFLAIQACLDKGGTIVLSAGHPGYLIERGLKMGSDTILTSEGSSATLAAHSTLGNQPILYASGSNYTISNIIFDGKKYERDVFGLCWDISKRPANLETHGNNFTVHHIDTVNAMCGSGFGVFGSGHIYRVYSANNGRQVGQWPNAPFQWADGMTVVYCHDGHIHDNTFVDNTDFDLLFGGGPNCNVHHNTIIHINTFAFGGMNIGHMETGAGWNGNHIGSIFSNNTIGSRPNLLMYGLSVGSHAFVGHDPKTVQVYNAGTISNNSSTGSQINFLVDGVDTGTIINNTFSDPQGDRSEYNNCKVSKNYISGHTGFEPQNGYSPMIMDNGKCQTY